MPQPDRAILHPADALRGLSEREGDRSIESFRHGTLVVKMYAPRGIDLQAPHARDETYVVIQGSGTFFDGEERRAFHAGDLLFVAAGIEHRFENFTDDLAVWVMFYGPEGGEGAS